MTYSILGRDPAEGEIGIAVQSKFPGVGSIVCHGRPGVGVIATQAFASPGLGSRGLDLLELGADAVQALGILLKDDDRRGERQIAILPMTGEGAAETGEAVRGWAGEALAAFGNDCIAHGNSLSNETVPRQMVAAFERAEGDLPDRLITALEAGEAAGGELRGVQSAALLVVKDAGGYQGSGGVHVDISVYDHPDPIAELARCMKLHRLSYFPSSPENLRPIDEALAAPLRELLRGLGYRPGEGGPWSDADIAAMERFMGTENFDNRIRDDALVDTEVLDEVKRRYPAQVNW
ncbi:MAG: DUF1028 domain-containing protein [Rhizobiaceae bacterium]|nr:DUF1028 domain-containing protein [Rhizobiaceae bacterium]MCV0407849.1 DUF1028 domain-containing protein [Rhizobiaceae bacterium]